MRKIDIKNSAVLLLALLASVPVLANQQGERAIKKDYPVTSLTKHVNVIFGPNEEVTKENQGFRNNPVIISTSKGVVVVDPGSSVYTGEMVVKKVKELTSDPVIAVFNSHSHGDHWLGNDGIRKHFPNVDIYAHKKMIQELEINGGQMWVSAINKRSEGAITGTRVVIPNKPVKDGDSIRFGDTTIRIHHSGKAHSPSDIMLEVVEDKVFLLGDVLRVKNLSPFMSSFSGNLKALDVAEKVNAKIYVPGHGTAGGKEIMQAHRTLINTLKSEVKKYYDEGLSDFEMKPKVIKALKKYRGWSGFDENVGRLINLMYLEVEAEQF